MGFVRNTYDHFKREANTYGTALACAGIMFFCDYMSRNSIEEARTLQKEENPLEVKTTKDIRKITFMPSTNESIPKKTSYFGIFNLGHPPGFKEDFSQLLDSYGDDRDGLMRLAEDLRSQIEMLRKR